MDELIDDMDLTKGMKKEDEQYDDEEEAFKPKLTFNPYIQRLYQVGQFQFVKLI